MIGLLCTLALAAASRPAAPPPALLFVRSQGSTADSNEGRLFEAVGLLLDDFMIVSEPAGEEGFAQWPLARQLELVLTLAKADQAVAGIWMAEPVRGQLMLHVLAIGSGRAMVRTIEYDRKSQSERAIALLLRELLGTAFLLEPPREVPPALTSVVRTVRQAIPSDPSAPAEVRPAVALSPWGLGISVTGSLGVETAQSITARVGFSVGLERRLGSLVWLELGAGASFLRGDNLGVTEVPLSLSAHVLFPAGPVRWGPFVGTQVGWMSLSSAEADTTSALSLFFGGGFEVRGRPLEPGLTPRAALYVRGTPFRD